MRLRRILIVLAILMLPPSYAVGQGCAMCYSTAQAASKDGQRAIARGIVILVIPPLGVVTLGLGLAFRYGRKRDQDQEQAH
ncbi:MAG TPA: hypothetical protein VMT67_13760 [Terriglobales bacterium]|nr:hypothetical protein [Terriglobales bacterium]